MAKKLPKARKKKNSLPTFFLFLGLSIVTVAFLSFIQGQKTPKIDACANSISCISNLNGEFEDITEEAIFLNNPIKIPNYIARVDESFTVLGEKTTNKQIYVDLTTQHLYAFEDNKLIFDFPVSTGKWGATPTGTFSIWVKLRYTRMSGGNPAIGTYYNLPNVPYTMFYYNKDVPKSVGYSIHGAYWHDNFGHPMSHGCVNMRTEDVAKIYYWANPPSNASITYANVDAPGTEIIVYGTAPSE